MSLFCNRSHSFSPSQKAIYVYVLPYQFPFWEAGHKIIEPPPTIPFLYPKKRSGCTFLYPIVSGHLLASQATIWCTLQTNLTRRGQHHNSTPRTAPPSLHFPSQPPPAATSRHQPPAASGHCHKQASPLPAPSFCPASYWLFVYSCS